MMVSKIKPYKKEKRLLRAKSKRMNKDIQE